jgi:hypothetical protein
MPDDAHHCYLDPTIDQTAELQYPPPAPLRRRARRLVDRLPRLSALEREALHALLRHADVAETAHGFVIVAPVSARELEVLELVGALADDLEDEPDNDGNHEPEAIPHVVKGTP